MIPTSFTFIRRHDVASLKLTVEEYRHEITGARHFHLAAKDDNNAFLVAFLTVPTDSTGVAHVLEHTTLCGSHRYPVRDPFFMMLRRSLSTFMNAFTASDWTAYPFATRSPKDFHNLLQVYLDAVFFPRLDPLDFSQEGHRVEPVDLADPEGILAYKGIVFNEMKGAMSAPTRRLGQTLQTYLFPTTTYHHNSGGEPETIPDLTYEQLIAFHQKHYHPSNAVFTTYGDIPASQHHIWIEEYALNRFSAQPIDLGIADERRYSAPLVVEEPYSLEAGASTARRTHVVLGWLLGKNVDPLEVLTARLLSGVLLDNSASPLSHALETTDLGTAPSELNGLDDSTREMTFGCGLEGSERAQAEKVEALVFSVLKKVAEEGVPSEQVEAVLHQLELHQREIKGGGTPYGLRLAVGATSRALHGGDPISALDIDETIAELRRRAQEKNFIPNLVHNWLLDNPHRVRVTLYPDPTLDAKTRAAEQDRLTAVGKTLDTKDRTRLVELAKKLAERQTQEQDPEILPCVCLADVPSDLYIPEGEELVIAGMPTTWYGQGTNGLVYQQIILDLPKMDPESVENLPLFCQILTEVGSGGRTYLETQILQSTVTGSIASGTSLRSPIHENSIGRGRFSLGGKALTRNHTALMRLLQETLLTPRFDELDRLRELVAQERAGRESSVTDRGHVLAMIAASAAWSPLAALGHRWGGLLGLTQLKALDDRLNQDGEREAFSEQLRHIVELLSTSPRRLLLVGEPRNRDKIVDFALETWSGYSVPTSVSSMQVPTPAQAVREGWATSTQVQFCAKAYAAVPVAHEDAAAFAVLGPFLRNGYLHRAIREQGGAYGGGASYDGDSCTFRFYSYRDPRLADTLEDFDRSVAWLLSGRDQTSRTLEEAILGVIGSIDHPDSPAGEAVSAYFAGLHGRTPAHRRAFRSRVLQVTLEDLHRVASTYLDPKKGSVAVISDSTTLDREGTRLGLTLRQV